MEEGEGIVEVDPFIHLGKGAFGTVNRILGNGGVPEYFALKSIPIEPLLAWRYHRNVRASQVCSTRLISTLWNEVILLNSLNHDNVVRYYDSWIKGPDKEELEKMGKGQPNTFDLSFLHNSSSSSGLIPSSNRFQIKMEYCESDLRKWLILRPTLENRIEDASTALELFRQIMSGLEYIHSKPVIHRDLKPENIFLQICPTATSSALSSHSSSINIIVKIGDFGISRQVKDLEESNLTAHLGNPMYQSPEMWAGRSYNEKTDIYTAGLILYEMLHPLQIPDLENPSLIAVSPAKLLSRNEAFGKLFNACLENSLGERFAADFRRHFPSECFLVHEMTRVVNPIERPGASKVLQEIGHIKSLRRLRTSPTCCADSSSEGVTLNVTLDIEETPDLAEYAQTVKQIMEGIYPKITAYLDYPGHSSPSEISLSFKDQEFIGTSSAEKIVVSTQHFRNRQNQEPCLGFFVLLAVLSVEKYDDEPKPPQWWIDGLATYFRRYWFENGFDVRKPRSTDNYKNDREAAAYLIHYINSNYGKDRAPDLIQETHREGRQGRFRDAAVIQLATGKTIDELWKEMLEFG